MNEHKASVLRLDHFDSTFFSLLHDRDLFARDHPLSAAAVWPVDRTGIFAAVCIVILALLLRRALTELD